MRALGHRGKASAWLISAVLISSLCLLFSCSQTKPRIEDLPLPEAAALKARANANRDALRDFAAAGILELSSRQMGRSALGIELKYVSPDYLWLSLNAAMGIEVGTLFLSHDRYELSYGRPKVHASGQIEDFVFPDNMGLDLSGEDVFDIMLPLTPISAIPDSARLERAVELQQYQLSWSDSNEIHQLWADPFRPVITRELILSPDGDTLASKQISDVKKRANVHFPQSWRVRLGRGDQAYLMKLKLSRLDINSGLQPDDLRPGEESQADSVEAKIGR